MHHRLRPPEVGRDNVHLLFKSNLAQFEGLSSTFNDLELPTRSTKAIKNKGQVNRTTCHLPSLF